MRQVSVRWASTRLPLRMLLLSAALATGCAQESPVSPAPSGSSRRAIDSRVLARVGGHPVGVDEFKSTVASLPGGERRLQRPGGAHAELDRMVDSIVVEEEAKRRALTNDSVYVERSAAIRAQAALQEQELLSRLLQQKLAQEVQLTEDDLRAQYEKSKGHLLTSNFHVRRIVVDNEQAAQAARQRIAAGEDFSDVAAAVTTEPALKAARGDLGTLPLSEIPVALQSRVLSLQTANQVTDPFSAEGKWNLLQLVSRDDAVLRGFEEVRAQLDTEVRTTKAAEAFQKLLNAQREALHVEIDESLLAQLGPPGFTPGSRPVVHAGPLTPRSAGDNKEPGGRDSVTPQPAAH